MRTLALATALATLASVAMAEPVAGVWQTQPDDNGNFGHVQIAPCDSGICGVIVRAFNPDGTMRESDTIGMRIVWGMEATGNGNYRGGKIHAPDRGKTYNSRMELEDDTLTVKGCVLGICRGQTWTRVN